MLDTEVTIDGGARLKHIGRDPVCRHTAVGGQRRCSIERRRAEIDASHSGAGSSEADLVGADVTLQVTQVESPQRLAG